MDGYNNKNNSGYDEFEEEASSKESSPSGKFSKQQIMEALKKPKNIFILIGAILFILVAFFKLTGGPKKEASQKLEQGNLENNEIIPQVLTANESVQPIKEAQMPAQPIAPPSLPSLDIDLLKNLQDAPQKVTKPEKDEEDLVNSIDLESLKKELNAPQNKEEDSFEDFLNPKETQVQKIRKVDPEKPPAPIFDSAKNSPNFVDKSQKRAMSDFIFIDSSLDAEDSSEVPNEGKKIPNLGNIVAQGRIIDAVLESAIDSSIPGTIRAVVSKDVYAEAGRSILIPKGTRLYGAYTAGGGRTGRTVITWSRIIRPDGISLGIDSFASDQFGRAGVEGDVDKKYGEIIASALLLSSIPLVATIATQQVTGGRKNDVTITNPNGTITNQSDPVNKATEKFASDVAQATEQVVKNLIDTTIVVKIPQGTRIKVMVNQDLKLPRYKPLTALNTTVTNSSQ